MKTNSLFLLLISLTVLNACSKSEDILPINPVLPPVYGTALYRVYEIDTTKTAPADTITRWSFTYDALNRVILDSFSSTTISPGLIYRTITKIEYSGTDTFAYRKTQRTVRGSIFMSADTTYYTFLNGRYAADTTVFDYGSAAPPGTSRNNFTYSPNVITRNFQNWVPAMPYTATETQRIYTTIVNNNITAQTDTMFSVANGFPQAPVIFNTTVSYLNNPNPFFKVTAPYTSTYFKKAGIGNTEQGNRQYAPRNLISQQTSTSGTISYVYALRTDGYPLTAWVSNNQYGTSVKTKLIFVYQ